jgi:hypothetical protein
MIETRTNPALDRRGALKALLGLAAITAGAGTLLMPAAAEAAFLGPKADETPEANPANPDIARDDDLPASEPTQYYYYRRRRVYRPRRVYYRPRRAYYYRPRRVYRRRHIRRVYVY